MGEIKLDLREDFRGDFGKALTLDVYTTFTRMKQAGILSWRRADEATTLMISRMHGLAELDAAAAVVAESIGWPILVADRALYERMLPLQNSSGRFAVLWLPDYMDAWDSAQGQYQ